MTGHILGSLCSLVMAGVLGAVTIGDRAAMPGWLYALALLATALLVANAARLFVVGRRRKRVLEGPRTRIVLSDLPPPPERKGY